MRRSRSRLRKFLVGMLVISLFAAIGFWLSPYREIISYDQKTIQIGIHLGKFTRDQWELVYRESEVIFLAHKGQPTGRMLKDEELPKLLQNLQFDLSYVDRNGVFYKRVGGGWSDATATQVHSIHLPDIFQHDRKGIWFDGFQTFEWVYEPDRTEE